MRIDTYFVTVKYSQNVMLMKLCLSQKHIKSPLVRIKVNKLLSSNMNYEIYKA